MSFFTKLIYICMGKGAYMDFILGNFESFISALILIPTIVYALIKIIYRTKIEIILENKYKNKINGMIEIGILSLFLSTIISFGGYRIGEIPNFISDILPVILLCILLIFCISFVVLSIAFVINGIRKIKNNNRVYNFYRVIFVIQYLSLLCLNAGLMVLEAGNLELNEIILIILWFVVLYVVIFSISRFSFNQVRRRDHYEVTVLKENINVTLGKLILLYSLNKELLIMREKTDKEKDVNELKIFYVYYLKEGFILKYKEV